MIPILWHASSRSGEAVSLHAVSNVAKFSVLVTYGRGSVLLIAIALRLCSVVSVLWTTSCFRLVGFMTAC